MQSSLHSALAGGLAGAGLWLGFQGPILPQLVAIAQVLFLDLVLAGDNAVMVALAVTGLPPARRRQAVVLGVGVAAVIRIGLASVALELLAVVGLTLAGGLLLLWVCWRMYRELRPHPDRRRAAVPKSLGAAMLQIVLADVSMSVDNVLAVAGAARGRFGVLVVGLAASIVMMAVAASLIAHLLERFRWLAWLGLMVVLFVAGRLIWDGSKEIILLSP